MRFEEWEKEAFDYLSELYSNFFKELAEKSLKKAIKALDNAKVKGLVHKNKVDREKSRLTKKVNTMEVK